jgi:hypothetical protein
MHAFVRLLATCVAFLTLCNCATAPHQWSLADANLAASAKELSREDLDEIVRVVSPVFFKHILAIGRTCSSDAKDEMNVLVEYSDDGVWVYRLRKADGHWHIFFQGPGSFMISPVWTEC